MYEKKFLTKKYTECTEKQKKQTNKKNKIILESHFWRLTFKGALENHCSESSGKFLTTSE